ncbi:inosine/xanthosine triphosphatase [Candidatus Woesearchaeota archaeon CG10_big_fil_rev_8_21_14_0_10_45_16]|nr:MAG: inosine/xanthosine triphosphatase [Candidatus Woesearchaeota archaeon CG10_big_fil_rev_8_21_14_0_10_45_16]
MMKVLVGSGNPVKVKAVEEAFSLFFKDVIVEGINVPSGVSDQPKNEETFRGAKQRAENLRQLHPDADFFVGIEGGIQQLHNIWFANGVMCIIDNDGKAGFGLCPHYSLPAGIVDELMKGEELGNITTRFTNVQNEKQKGGFIGFLTEGVVDRKGLYLPGIIMALVPFVKKEMYFGDYKKETIISFDRYQQQFEKKFEDYVPLIQEEMREFLRLLPARAKLLDLGSGSGNQALYLKNKGHEVLCIDLSEEMVKSCLEKGLQARVMDFENFVLQERFDAVLAYTSLLHIPKKNLPKMLERVHSLLDNDGIFFLAMKEGKTEGFVSNDQRYPQTKRWFSLYEDAEIREYLKDKFQVESFSETRLENKTFLNYICRKKIRVDQSKLYQTQISFTEWFEKIDHHRTNEMRLEDNEKRERLKILKEEIGTPFDEPTQFSATDLKDRSAHFQEFLDKRGDDLCALRLIPTYPDLPKLRMRGHTVKDVMHWFREQNIDPSQYKADFVPHAEDYLWSTIFVINRQGIFGEIIRGGHYQLTQGFYDQQKPIFFSYNFENWYLSEDNQEAKEHLIMITDHLQVAEEKKAVLRNRLDATFSKNYLDGYFETASSGSQGLWFCDYNRILGKMYDTFMPNLGTQKEGILSGQMASAGKAQGRVKIVHNIRDGFQPGEILVTSMTSPDFVPLMQKASAIVTDQGGILSHAAIVSRELGIPCIVGTEVATKVLKNGDLVEVDAEKGTVRKLE